MGIVDITRYKIASKKYIYIISSNNSKINETSNGTLYHTVINSIEENTSNYDFNNRSNMDDLFNNFVKHINSNDGRKFFHSFLAGDYETSKKLALTLSLHGDQSDEVKTMSGISNSSLTTQSEKEDRLIFKKSKIGCELHQNGNCKLIDNERFNKLAICINYLEFARDIKKWIYQLESVLEVDYMEYILDQAAIIKADRKQKFKVKVCELIDASIATNVIIKFVSKPVRNYIKERVQETEYNDSPHLFSYILEFFNIQCNDREFFKFAAEFKNIDDMNTIIKVSKHLKYSTNLLEKVYFDEEEACIELFINNNIPIDIERSWNLSERSLDSLISMLEWYTRRSNRKYTSRIIR